VNCLGHVHVTCANAAETLVLQKSSGWLWVTVTTDEDRNRDSINLQDEGPFGRVIDTTIPTVQVPLPIPEVIATP